MPNTKLKPGQKAYEIVESADATLFGTILGARINPKWFEWLLGNSGPYLFTGALIFGILKLGVLLYQYIKSPKNIYNTSGFIASTITTALTSVAIIGALAAAATFVLATPILFTIALSLDTIRNIGITAVNIFKLIRLNWKMFPIKKQKSDAEAAAYESHANSLREEYWGNIKKYGFGSIVTLLATAAVVFTFLAPHVSASLVAIGAIGFTVAGFKFSIAGIAGGLAAAGMIIPIIKSGLTKIFSNKRKEAVVKTLKQVEAESLAEKTTQKPHIQNNLVVESLFTHADNFKKDVVSNPKWRSAIIQQIDEESHAIDALLRMIEEKVSKINHEYGINQKAEKVEGSQNTVQNGKAQNLPTKINQKLEALAKLKEALEKQKNNLNSKADQDSALKSDSDTATILTFRQLSDMSKALNITGKPGMTDKKAAFEEILAERKRREDAIEHAHNVTTVVFETPSKPVGDHFSETVKHLKTLPGIQQSFFREVSDTQRIVEAFKLYLKKFSEQNTQEEKLNHKPK